MTSEIRSVNIHLEKLAIVYIFFSCQELVGLGEVSAGSPQFSFWKPVTIFAVRL